MVRHTARLALTVCLLGEVAHSAPACTEAQYSQDNCVRVLACVGDRGLWFDGQARGWDAGTLAGAISDGTGCAGTWNSQGFLGTGFAELTCEDGVKITAIYTAQDPETGTAIGSGRDSLGRAIQAWSGRHVLEFLSDQTGEPQLPCTAQAIPLG